MTERAPGSVVMLLSNGLSSDPRVEKEASALAGAGRRVTVIAWDRSGELPPAEERSGFAIERLGPPAEHGAGLRNLGLYRAWWREAAARAVELRPDVVHCHDLDTAPAGLRAVRDAGRAGGDAPKLVLDFHELYRESAMVPQAGIVGSLTKAAVRTLERRAIPRADAVIVANPGTVEYYRPLGATGRLVVVENAPDAEAFRPAASRQERVFTVGFAGQKRYMPPLFALLDAVRGSDELAAVLAGGGTGAAQLATAAQGVPRVEVSGPFRYADLPALYERFDAVYAVYETHLGNVRTLFPVKVMEGMACALPVVVAEGTWAGDYVVENRIGVAVPAGDAETLRGALLQLARDPEACAAMGARGRRLVEQGLNWAAASGRLLSTYERLAPL